MNMRVLCVQPHPRCSRALAELLDGLGYDVVTAMSGREALELLREQPFDGVLLEYELPDANGVCVRSDMKRIVPDIPVLLFFGVGHQTPMLVRFFDLYLRDGRSRDSPPEAMAS